MTTGGTNQPPFVISSPWLAQLLPPALQLCADGPPKWSGCPPAQRRHGTNRPIATVHPGSAASLSKLLSCDQPTRLFIHALPSGFCPDCRSQFIAPAPVLPRESAALTPQSLSGSSLSLQLGGQVPSHFLSTVFRSRLSGDNVFLAPRSA